jgi:hypothetical protein
MKNMLLGILAIVLVSGCVSDDGCASSGGTVVTGSCCLSSGDFPNSCMIGACGCSLEDSHDVKTCDCGEGKCFDGTSCK